MKNKIYYVCSNCGYQSAKWSGKCSSCGEWGTFEQEEKVSKKSKKLDLKKRPPVKFTKLSEIENSDDYRINTGLKEFNRVLGGGIVPGSLILIAGDPGIGKSTLTLQITKSIIGNKPLYVTGEESLGQIKHRASRLNDIPDNLNLLAETDLDKIIDAISSDDCEMVIVDSIQSVYMDSLESTPGSVVQVRECTSRLMQAAKRLNKPIFIIGHVNKEGNIAGPKMLEHMVDTVLQFEGEKEYNYRILRAIKNRYGSTNEIGIFEMTSEGLREVSNPSELFLSGKKESDPGVVTVASTEGNRPILIEIQALVSPTGFSVPQRTTTGFDSRRLQMIIAVLEKRLGAKLFKHDVFVNIAGGLRVNDTSTDLGVAAALVSSLHDNSIARNTVIVGEIGLTGEVRNVSQIEQKIKESEKLGFKKIIIPDIKKTKFESDKIKIVTVDKISTALKELFEV